jgi:hypothetical protein
VFGNTLNENFLGRNDHHEQRNRIRHPTSGKAQTTDDVRVGNDGHV